MVALRPLVAFAIAAISFAIQVSAPDLLRDAQQELFAARYEKAAVLYANALNQNPGNGEAHYGLVRALLKAHRQEDAYIAAAGALQSNSNTAEVQTAAGLAAFRRGELAKAEEHFRTALKADPNYAGALSGFASVYSVVSRFRSARDFTERAYRARPDDPDLMGSWANTLQRREHIDAVEKVLSMLDPASEEAQHLRAHVANVRALGDRKIRRLVSAYTPAQIKMLRLAFPSGHNAVGLRVQLNRRQTATMLLDTGASGVGVSPALAKKAALEILGPESSKAKGIGDKPPVETYSHIASQMRIGDVTFADYPIDVFKSAKSTDYDGIIGADVFEDFVVTLDFPRLELTLTPRPGYDPAETREPEDANASLADGFYRAVRFGNHLALPTLLNGKTPTLFLIDSGASANLIDTEVGRAAAKLRSDDLTRVEGIQGAVKKTSRADRVELIFAGFRQDNPDLLAISLDKVGDDMGITIGGILGMPVLAQLRMTIDYHEGAVRLEYRR